MASPDLAGTLALILQSLRSERGWSLDQLALRSGVSKGVLVALEQGRSNPNLATLARIADAFGVPVTRLLDVPDEPVVRITGQDHARSSLARPGWRDRHDHRGDRASLGGRAVALDGAARRAVWRRRTRAGQQGADLGRIGHDDADRVGPPLPGGPGQCARFPGSLPHAYANEGTEPARMTMISVVPPALA